MEFIVHDKFLKKDVFDIQQGKSKTTEASSAYQKALRYESVVELFNTSAIEYCSNSYIFILKSENTKFGSIQFFIDLSKT